MSHPTLVPSPSSQASSLLKSRLSLEWSFAIRASVQGEASLYPEVNHLSGNGHVNPFLFLGLCDWKVLKILGHCLADLSWNGAYAGATVHRYFGLLRRKKHLSLLRYNRIVTPVYFPKSVFGVIILNCNAQPKYPMDEQLRLLDISSNNSLPSVLFELESIIIFFQGHVTTVLCKIPVRRSVYCLEFSMA